MFIWMLDCIVYQRIAGESGRALTPIENLLGGMSAGTFSTLGNNPFDVAKTRMQVGAHKVKRTLI
jgi:Mitochondrial carrier protein